MKQEMTKAFVLLIAARILTGCGGDEKEDENYGTDGGYGGYERDAGTPSTVRDAGHEGDGRDAVPSLFECQALSREFATRVIRVKKCTGVSVASPFTNRYQFSFVDLPNDDGNYGRTPDYCKGGYVAITEVNGPDCLYVWDVDDEGRKYSKLKEGSRYCAYGLESALTRLAKCRFF